MSPELVVELLEKLLPSDSGNGNGKGICEIIFPQSIAFNTGLTIGILRFNKRRALTDAPLRGIFLVPQKNGQHNFALSLQTMAQHLLQEMQAAEANMTKMFDTPQSKQKQDPPEDTPGKTTSGRTRAPKRQLQHHPSILSEK